MLAKVLCFMVFVGLACGATWIGKPPKKPPGFENKEGCYIKEINDVVPFGTVLTPIGHCYRITCSPNMIDYASCGSVHTNDPHCYTTETDLSRPYPGCCPDIKCDLDNHLV